MSVSPGNRQGVCLEERIKRDEKGPDLYKYTLEIALNEISLAFSELARTGNSEIDSDSGLRKKRAPFFNYSTKPQNSTNNHWYMVHTDPGKIPPWNYSPTHPDLARIRWIITDSPILRHLGNLKNVFFSVSLKLIVSFKTLEQISISEIGKYELQLFKEDFVNFVQGFLI